LGILISSSSSLLCGFLTATNKEYQKVTLPSNPDSFPPMQIDKISHIAVKVCQYEEGHDFYFFCGKGEGVGVGF
jgi:hypothetical protein